MNNKKWIFLSLFTIAFSILILPSCQKSKKDKLGPLYWKKDFYLGNLKINGADLPLYKDALVGDKSADYIKYSELNENDIQIIEVKIYIPTDTNQYQVVMTNPQVALTPELNAQLEANQAFNTELEGTQYAVFNFTTTVSNLNRDNLMNIKFMGTFDYVKEGQDNNTRNIEANIYLKHQ